MAAIRRMRRQPVNEEQEVQIQGEQEESSEEEFHEVEEPEPEQEMELDRSRWPTKGHWIRMKRKPENDFPEDQWMSSEILMKVKIPHKLRAEKYGRMYFNIQYEDGTVGGIYLAMDDMGRRDPIWSLMREEEEQEMGT